MLIEALSTGWNGYIEIWVSANGTDWTQIANWGWFTLDDAGNMSIPDVSAGQLSLYGLSSIPFQYVRVGTTDPTYQGSYLIDAVKLDGQAIFGSSAQAVVPDGSSGFVNDPNNVLAEDGATCTIRPVQTSTEFIGVEVDFGSLQQPVNPWPDDSIDPSTFNHGVYLLGYPNSDPNYNPPGYTYTPSARDIAPYAWSLINGGTQQLLDDVLAINPNHKWYQKLALSGDDRDNTTLEYFYDAGRRATLDADWQAQLDAVPTGAAGISCDEEEWQWPFLGYNVNPEGEGVGLTASQWMLDYSTEIDGETGIDITIDGWNTGPNLRTLRYYLADKAEWQFDRFYDMAKATNAAWNVQQFIVGNTWRWTVPADIKRDQWHLYLDWQNPGRWFGRTLNYKGTNYAVAWKGLEADQVAWNCRSQASLAKDETLCRVMVPAEVASSGPVDVERDLALLAEAGIQSPYYFYYGSYVPPNPDTIPTFDDTNETEGQWSAQDAADWRHSYAQRVIVENMFRLTAYPGDTASTDGGTWVNEDTIEYQWVQAEDYNGFNPQNIDGETSATYLVRTDDIDKYIGCQVTATNADGSTTVSTEFAAVLPLPVTFQAAWAQHATQTIQQGLPR